MGTNTTTSYLDPPQLIGRPNADGTISITPLELKKLNDYNYYVAKMLQGGLNLANLNGATNQVFTDIQGNVTEITETAQGLTSRVSSAEGNIVTAQQTASSASVTASNALGEAQQVKLTVDGLSVADETGSYTIIDGDKFVSKDHATSKIVQIENGDVLFKKGAATVGSITPNSVGLEIEASDGQWVYIWGNAQLGLFGQTYVNGDEIFITASGSRLKLLSYGNVAIDSNGTIYIGASVGQSGNVDIGQAGGTVNLVGNVYINGVLQ